MIQFLEVMMLLMFGLSWPFNIVKSIRSRTARGKATSFQILVIIGYICGLASKFLSGNISYVVIVYVLDIMMVTADLLLTIRNRHLDKMRDRAAEEAA